MVIRSPPYSLMATVIATSLRSIYSVPSAVLWTLLHGFVIFPNHPSPDMLECHEEVYYNNQTEAVERDKTCKLDKLFMMLEEFINVGKIEKLFELKNKPNLSNSSKEGCKDRYHKM